MFVRVYGVNLEPRNVDWPTIRHFNQGTGYGSSAYPKKTQPGHAQRDRPKMEYMQQCVGEQGDTSLQREQGGERHCDARWRTRVKFPQ